MDARHFDTLTRTLTTTGTRRGLLGLLATLPLLGGLFALLDPDESDARGRRHRRRVKRHKHGKGRRRVHDRKCDAESKGKTCAGTCGSVKNNCGNSVDCGSCDCDPPCVECFICQSGPNTPGACVPDPEQIGDPCGSEGQLCQADGNCACQAGSCPDAAPICLLGECEPCTTNTQCQLCQICEAGLCVADPTLNHTCVGPCPSGEWCDAGVCAGIQATVRVTDCQSLCEGSTEVCGQTVTCPSCNLCGPQTGCATPNSLTLPEGPVGPGTYCSLAGGIACTSNADCADDAPFIYCRDGGSAGEFCTRICPF